MEREGLILDNMSPSDGSPQCKRGVVIAQVERIAEHQGPCNPLGK